MTPAEKNFIQKQISRYRKHEATRLKWAEEAVVEGSRNRWLNNADMYAAKACALEEILRDMTAAFG